jgi:hypothetical protein
MKIANANDILVSRPHGVLDKEGEYSRQVLFVRGGKVKTIDKWPSPDKCADEKNMRRRYET